MGYWLGGLLYHEVIKPIALWLYEQGVSSNVVYIILLVGCVYIGLTVNLAEDD